MKAPLVIYKDRPQPHSWCKWTVSRVKNRNNSTNIRFVGDTGSGKSWSALSIAEIMAAMMNKVLEESDIYFSISDVIRKVYNESPPPGTIFFIDEQQIDGASGEFNNLRGKAYTAFFSTVRSKRYIIISTMPFADMVVKKVRRFFHVEIETLSVDENKKVVNSKPRLLDYHKHKDKIYRKMLVMQVRNQNSKLTQSIKINTWQIPKPSTKLVEIYEQKKEAFQHQTYGQLVRDLDKFENKHVEKEEESKQEVTLERLTDYQRAVYDLIAEYPERTLTEISNMMLGKGFKSSQSRVSGNIRWMKNKGVIVMRRRSKSARPQK